MTIDILPTRLMTWNLAMDWKTSEPRMAQTVLPVPFFLYCCRSLDDVFAFGGRRNAMARACRFSFGSGWPRHPRCLVGRLVRFSVMDCARNLSRGRSRWVAPARLCLVSHLYRARNLIGVLLGKGGLFFAPAFIVANSLFGRQLYECVIKVFFRCLISTKQTG